MKMKLNRKWTAVIVASLLTVGAAGQAGTSAAGSQGSASANQTGSGTASASTPANAGALDNGASAVGGMTVQAELTKTLDAKKAKQGDEVTAKVLQDVKSNGQILVRRGAKLVGHVTQAQARNKENAESKLGIVFDKAVAKDGSQIPLSAVVQALAPAERVSAQPMPDVNSQTAGSSQPPRSSEPMSGSADIPSNRGTASTSMGEVGRTAGNVAGAASTTVAGAGGSAGGTLNDSSHGVIGMRGLTLNSGVAQEGGVQTSVVSSSTENVKLENGTQLILMVNAANQK
jgi:hypothetical protein